MNKPLEKYDKKILVVRFRSLGDLILTTGPLSYFRKQKPRVKVDLLTSELGDQLFLNNPHVDKTIVVPKGSNPMELRKIYQKLDSYDLIIDWQNNFKSWFLGCFQKIPIFKIDKQGRQRRAFVRNRSYRDQLNKQVVEKYYEVLKKAFPEIRALNPETKEADKEALRPVLKPELLMPETNPSDSSGSLGSLGLFDSLDLPEKNSFPWTKAVAIHPYASQYNKEWPYFKSLCERLNHKGIPVLVLGSSKQKLHVEPHPLLLDLTNKTSLGEMAYFLSQTQALVTTDSGPMHMGIAVNTPTLALFGPTTKEFGFYPSFAHTAVAEIDLSCRPCHVHGGRYCPRDNHQCMRYLGVDVVEKALYRLARISPSLMAPNISSIG